MNERMDENIIESMHEEAHIRFRLTKYMRNLDFAANS